MAQQTRLEEEAIDLRNETLLKNDYRDENDYRYDWTHKDAKSDGDIQGKGSGVAMGVAGLPGATKNRAISYSNVITVDNDDDPSGRSVGGLYDIEGRNGVGGRRKLKQMSLYNSGKEYGRNAIDTTLNELAGQYLVK